VVGLAQAFGGPAYQALIPSLVRSDDLPNAIALNSIQFNLARVIGPMLGWLALTGLGAAWCFSLNGISFIAVIISLALLRPHYVPVPTGDSVLTSMRQGLQFIRHQGAMESLIVLAFCMTLLAIPLIVFLPVFARDVFQRGPAAYTLLLCVSAAGSVSGALIVAYMGRTQKQGRDALLRLILLGVLMTAFAVSTSLVASCVLLFFFGAALISVFSMISSLVQLITADQMRGRVMSVYNVAFRGGMPIGSLVAGKLIDNFSAPWVLACNGVLLVVLGFYFLLVHRRVASL
jgi:predicted MFS family arabinose efflux permease